MIIRFPRRTPALHAAARLPALGRSVAAVLEALGNLDDSLALPGRADFSAALIELADDLDADPDLEEGGDAEDDPAESGLADLDALSEFFNPPAAGWRGRSAGKDRS